MSAASVRTPRPSNREWVEDAVETHHPGEIQVGTGPGYERERSAEAESDGDRRTTPRSLAELRRRGGEVVERLVQFHLLAVRSVVELVVARAEANHPDEEVTCLGAMLRGVPEMKVNDIPTERGMMFQCLVLGMVFKPHDMMSAARIGRAYSVVWGLISILLTALITRRLRGEVAAIFAALLLATSGINLITSFWARGQVHTVAFTLASMLVALRTRRQASAPSSICSSRRRSPVRRSPPAGTSPWFRCCSPARSRAARCSGGWARQPRAGCSVSSPAPGSSGRPR